MNLKFFESSKHIIGYCKDEENYYDLYLSDIRGHWFKESGTTHVKFDKIYRRKHTVDYSGIFKEDLSEIAGDYFDGSDKFHMKYLHETIKEEQMNNSQKNDNIKDKMFSHIGQLYCSNSDYLSDFTINCENSQVLNVHKFILASQSKYFEGFFRAENKSQVNLSMYSFDILKSCIDFMYTANIEIDNENAQDVLEVSNYLGINSLCDISAAYIASNIDKVK